MLIEAGGHGDAVYILNTNTYDHEKTAASKYL
jgi:hypothetical protein